MNTDPYKDTPMTARRPARMTVPSLENYPFINVMFHKDFAGFSDAAGEARAPDVDSFDQMAGEFFEHPNSVQNEQMAPIQAMNDVTFNTLFSLLKPTFDSHDIRTKAGLEAAAISRMTNVVQDEEDYYGPFTCEQLQAYMIFCADKTKNVQWAKVAALYNESAPDQQDALLQYFLSHHDIDLPDLLETTGPAITLPECVREEFQTKTKHGDTYHFSELKQRWLRDDRFHQQYRIDIVLTSLNARYLIGGAPTLDQAIAKASLCVIGDEYSAGNWRVDILRFAEPVAHAEVVAGKGILTKLKWNLDQLGADASYVQGIENGAKRSLNTFKREKDKIMGDVARLKELVDTPPPVPQKEFREALYRVEKALGLQWAKAHDLEDALGL
jgi:hypothetical protein